ncbi:MAG: recombinase family protein [Bacteroidetes bacterium]|nr:recombinase family protein [Bacteroidota bacterium]
MNVLYVRVSTVDQHTDRQLVKAKDYNLIVEDRCSGAVPFFERPGGKEILSYMEKNLLTTLSVWQIDRLGRNLRDVVNTIHFFSERGICIHFVAQGLRTLESNGSENPVTKMIISILGVVGEMERNQIRERQKEGIKLAKAKGTYKGRQADTKEDAVKFLSKEKNKKAVEYLKKGYKAAEAAKLAGVHYNTVHKIKGYMSRLNTAP